MARSRYKRRSSASVPTPTYDVVISTIPSNTSISAGVSYSLNLSSYVSGADAGLATLTLSEISGTLAAVDLSFSSPTISGSTPDVGSVSLQLVAKIGGVTIATSNTFIQGVIVVSTPDTFAPTIAAPPEVTVVSSSALDVVAAVPSDPNPDGNATGMASVRWQRSISPYTTWSNVGSAISVAVGQKPTWTSATIGTLSGTNSVAQSGANFSFQSSDGGIGFGTDPDNLKVTYTSIAGAFDFLFKIPAFTGYEWSECGAGMRASTSSTSAMIVAQCFSSTGAHGIASSYRPTNGGTRVGSSSVTAGVPADRWLRATRAAGSSTVFLYYLNGSGVWTLLESQSITTTDPVLLFLYACRNSTGGTDSPVIQAVNVNTLGTKTLNDTGLSGTYRYRLVATDVYGNSSTGEESAPASTSASGTIEWTGLPGLWVEGATWLTGNGLASVTDEPSMSRALSSTVAKGILLLVPWAHIENDAGGTYNFDRLDQYYAACAAAGKRLSIYIGWFTVGSTTSGWIPSYLSGSTYGGLQRYDYGYFVKVFRSDGLAMDRFSLLVDQIGQWAAGKSYFGFLTTPETAWNVYSPDSDLVGGSTPQAWAIDSEWDTDSNNLVTQIIRAIPAWRASMGTKLITGRWNWLTDYNAARLIAAAEAYGIGIGSTDWSAAHVTDMDLWMRGSKNGTDYRPRIAQVGGSEFPYFTSSTDAELVTYWNGTAKAHIVCASRDSAWSPRTWALLEAAVTSQGWTNTTRPTTL